MNTYTTTSTTTSSFSYISPTSISEARNEFDAEGGLEKFQKFKVTTPTKIAK